VSGLGTTGITLRYRAEQIEKLRGAWAGIITASRVIEGAVEATDVDVHAALRVLSDAALAIEDAVTELSGDESMFSRGLKSDDVKEAAE
jgi:hypothetical protein